MERATYTAQEFADKAGVNIKTVYTGMKTGEIPSIRLGARKLIPRAAGDRLLEQGNGRSSGIGG
jgi:excisionase family DNA binding protein